MNYYYITKLHLIVSDETDDIPKGTSYYNGDDNTIRVSGTGNCWAIKGKRNIIAGLKELPSINILNQQDKDRLGWIDVEQIAKEFDKHKFRHWKRELTNKEFYEIAEDGIKAGLQHQLSTKRYSEEDLRYCWGKAIESNSGTNLPEFGNFNEFKESLDQPKIIPIEIEMKDVGGEEWIGDDVNGEPFWNEILVPKITNNQIIILKCK